MLRLKPLLLLLVLTATFSWAQTTPPPREKPFVPPKRWAMVVGAGDYKQFGQLQYAAGDAKSFAKALIDQFDFAPDSIELITDAPGSDKKPDGPTIKEALARQIADRRLDKGDLFIFYFAGHGVGTAKGDLLLPTDATKENKEQVGQPVKEIVEMFVKAGLKNVLIVADACRAGEKNEFGEELQRLGRQANIAIMLGCQPGSRSYEYPALNHGAFTSFLLKALKNRKLCSPVSGALWASSVGDEVAKQVRDYTVRDYPDSPQSPVGLYGKDQDVLLGAFNSQIAATEVVGALKQEAGQMSAEKFVGVLGQFAMSCYKQDRYDDALEIYKSLEGLGKLGDWEQYVLAMCLEERGRHNESQKQFDLLRKQASDPLVKALAVIYHPSRTVTPAARLEGAKKAWEILPTEWVGFIAWSAVQRYGSTADANELLDKFVQTDIFLPRVKAFFEGYRAGNKGDWEAALREWDRAAKMTGIPGDDAIETCRYLALTSLGRIEEVVALLKKKGADEDSSGRWFLVLAEHYKQIGKKDEVIACLKTALQRDIDGQDLLWALRLSGMRYAEIADLVRKRAAEFPFSWKASLAKVWLADESGLDDALKLCDDRFAVIYEWIRVTDAQLADQFEMGRISEGDYVEKQYLEAAMLANNVDEFGYDMEVWGLMTKLSLWIQGYEQLQALFEVNLGKSLDEGKLHNYLRSSYLIEAMAMGDDRRVEQIWKLRGMPAPEQLDADYTMAVYYAVQGKIALARATMPSRAPRPHIAPIVRALKAYLNFFEGKPVDLKAVATAVKESPTAMQLIALCYASKANWKEAGHLLATYWNQRQITFSFVQAKVAQVYFDRTIATGYFIAANNMAHSVAAFAHGNPLYRKIHFGPKPGIENFVGSQKFEITAVQIPPEFVKGQMELVVAKTGQVTVTGKLGNFPLQGSGRIDVYGNLVSTFKAGGKEWRVTGKIAPAGLAKTFPPLAAEGQTFVMLEADGQSLMLVCRGK